MRLSVEPNNVFGSWNFAKKDTFSNNFIGNFDFWLLHANIHKIIHLSLRPEIRSARCALAFVVLIFPTAWEFQFRNLWPVAIHPTVWNPTGAQLCPNQLAAPANSRIMVAWLNVANEVCHGRFLRARAGIMRWTHLYRDTRKARWKNAHCEMWKPAFQAMKSTQWKGGWVVKGIWLEIRSSRKATVGSNPTPSAILNRTKSVLWMGASESA